MARNPIVAGQFYSADPDELEQQIRDSFMHEQGPGRMPEYSRKGRIKAVISPHAGYMFSGPGAAWSFLEIAESELADVYIVVGPNHSGMGSSSLSSEGYKTPLGIIKTDKDMCGLITKETGLADSSQAHKNEHSVEVQMPFLQFACRDRIDRLKIVPVVLGHDTEPAKLGRQMKRAVQKSGKKVVFIISSDMTHFGWSYGYVPFKEDIRENLYKMDRETLALVEESRQQDFDKRLDRLGATVCGRQPISMLMNAVDADEIKLLHYYTSGDILRDYSSAVGYASVVFK